MFLMNVDHKELSIENAERVILFVLNFIIR